LISGALKLDRAWPRRHDLLGRTNGKSTHRRLQFGRRKPSAELRKFAGFRLPNCTPRVNWPSWTVPAGIRVLQARQIQRAADQLFHALTVGGGLRSVDDMYTMLRRAPNK